MKYKYFYLWCISFALPTLAQAQSAYWPLLRPGLVYQLSEPSTPGDTTHTVRLTGAATPAGADSVYKFNLQVRRVTRGVGGCSRTHATQPNRLFGAQVVAGQSAALRGVYTLVARVGGPTFTLRLRQPLNQPWAVTGSGLTGQVTARTTGLVLGQPDSIVTISLSSGPTIRIGKRYGWLEGPAPVDVLSGTAVPRRLQLTALPALGLGNAALGDWGTHDYQPQDVFLRLTRQESASGATCSESWQRDSVLTRTVSTDGRTRTYTIWSRTLTRSFGFPSAPLGFCQGTSGTSLTPAGTYSLVVSRDSSEYAALLAYWVPPRRSNLGGSAYTTANYNGRKVQPHLGRVRCQIAPADSIWLGEVIDNYATTTWGAGLGLVQAYNTGIVATITTNLVGYRKAPLLAGGTPETWGSLRTFAQILSAKDKQPLTTTAAYPNPFAQALTLRFEAARAQHVTVRLYDALGRQVLTTSRVVQAGKAEVELPTTTVPAGLYTLHLLREGRTEVLKVAKVQ